MVLMVFYRREAQVVCRHCQSVASTSSIKTLYRITYSLNRFLTRHLIVLISGQSRRCLYGFWLGILLCPFIDKTSCVYNVVDQASYCVRLLPRLAVLIMFWPGILLSSFLDQAGWTYIVFHQASCWYNFLTRPAKLIKLLIRHLVVFASLTRPAQATKGHLKGRNRSHRPYYYYYYYYYYY